MDKPNVLRKWDILQSYFMIVIGAFYLCASIQVSIEKHFCVKNGERLPGKIARLEETKSDDDTIVFPIIAYATKEGKPREYRMDNPTTSYAVGDDIPLIVGPLPTCNVIIDRGFFNYRLGMMMGTISLLLLLSGLKELRLRKKGRAK